MNGKGISVLILTLNEEVCLPGCLEAVSWSDDIVVFDSFSTDRTVEIASRQGVRVVQRVFDNYASQRNAALTEVEYKNKWVLMVDADERWDDDLCKGMEAAIAEYGDEVAIFHFTRHDYFFGKCLRHSIASDTWAGRLVKPGHVVVKRGINEEYHTDEGKMFLPLKFRHYPLSKGIDFWFERHNRYSTMEAQALMDEIRGKLPLSGLLKREATARRKILKQLAFRMPCRSLLIFFYLYLFRLGLFDGIPGLRYALMRSMYEYMIDLKVAEFKYRKNTSEGEML